MNLRPFAPRRTVQAGGGKVGVRSPVARKPVKKEYGAKSVYTETAYERRKREARES